MIEVELNWATHDGLGIFAHTWEPETPPRAVLCLVHGIGEHSGRYRHVARALSRAGLAVLGQDLRGHGRSEGPRGHTPSYDALLEDIDVLLDQARVRYPGAPRLLLGHSLGGNLVLTHGLRRKPQVAGVIALSPALRLGQRPSAARLALGRWMNRVWPAYTQRHGLDLAGLSRDRDVVAAYRNDPLVHDRVSARLAIGVLAMGQWTLGRAGEFRLPVLAMVGDSDPLVDPAACAKFAHLVPNGLCTFKLWRGGYHELHNEPERESVMAAMVEWIDHVLVGQMER